MKHPLTIRDEVIVEAVQKHFDINVDQLSFIPEGEGSWLYACKEKATSKPLVIKIQKKPHVAESNVYVELHDAGYTYMPQPHLSRRHALWAKDKKLYYSVQDFIEPGENSEIFKLDDEYLPQLGVVLRELHNIVLPHKKTAKLHHETYVPQRHKKLTKFIALVQKNKFKKYPEIQRAVLENMEFIQTILADSVAIGKELKSLHLPLVLVHGDIHPYNLLRPQKGQVIIADWEACRIAHAEEDMMYFDDRQIGLISKGYGRNLLQNRTAIEYYRKHLAIRTLYFFGYEVGIEGETLQVRQRGLASFTEYIQELKNK